MADETLDQLIPLADKGIPIVGLEPSSLLSLRDDYFYLLKDDERVPLVAEHAFTFEEFIANLADEGTLDLTFTSEPRHILLHGHCHQKSSGGYRTGRARPEPAGELYRLRAGYELLRHGRLVWL